MEIKKALPEVRENVSLAQYTTIKIGGSARYFFIAENKEELIKAIKAAKENDLPFFIMAGGSNLLFSDEGFNGLVVKCQMSDAECRGEEIIAQAGARLDDLVKLSREKELTGLEWAAGIPGTIGGAVYGNAQAFGAKMSDIVKNVEALDIKSLEVKNLSKEECSFSSKNSVFKKAKNLIILSVVLELKKGDKKEIVEQVKKFMSYRKEKHPLNFPSAGSVFVNPEIAVKDIELLKKFPELKEMSGKKVIHSGYLIEKCGLKGRRIGNAQVSEKHANFIVNLGGAKAKDVLELIELIKREVKDKFEILLKKEIQIISSD